MRWEEKEKEEDSDDLQSYLKGISFDLPNILAGLFTSLLGPECNAVSFLSPGHYYSIDIIKLVHPSTDHH